MHIQFDLTINMIKSTSTRVAIYRTTFMHVPCIKIKQCTFRSHCTYICVFVYCNKENVAKCNY